MFKSVSSTQPAYEVVERLWPDANGSAVHTCLHLRPVGIHELQRHAVAGQRRKSEAVVVMQKHVRVCKVRCITHLRVTTGNNFLELLCSDSCNAVPSTTCMAAAGQWPNGRGPGNLARAHKQAMLQHDIRNSSSYD